MAKDPRESSRLLVKRAIRLDGSGWWVEGDNPTKSTDSRQFGPILTDEIVGRVLLRYRRGDRA